VTPFYEPAFGLGGMARASAALCRALARRGHEVAVVTAGGMEASAGDLGGVRVHRFAGPAFLERNLWPWAPALGRFLEAEADRFDIGHLHGHRSGLAWTASRALGPAGVPYALQTHGTYPHHGQRSLLKWTLDALGTSRIVAAASAVVAVSEAEARDLPRPARIVPNGVEPCGDATGATKASQPRILFVGTDRFHRKRAAALPALLRAFSGAELHVVGRVTKGLLGHFGGSVARVQLHGVLSGDALARAYAEAHVLVHPAVGEAFGLVPFEAALHGTPAVVAGGHGCGEWFGKAGGCVVPPDDPAALEAAVRSRLDDSALGKREAEAVASFARRELTWDRAAAALEAVYRELLPLRRR
jgi:glycosyltransferase involved in cell wall biosynthesis